MKKLILILIVIIFPVKFALESTLPVKEPVTIIKRADFMTTYNQIRKYEGNYADDKDDKGGITYGGITTRDNPNWYGWRYIVGDSIKNNQKFPKAEFWVMDYYLDIWVKEGFFNLKNQEIATYLFDLRINSNKHLAIKYCNRVFRKMGYREELIHINYNDEEWVSEMLNRVYEPMFLEKLKYERIRLYNILVDRDSTQSKFMGSWMTRANNIG